MGLNKEYTRRAPPELNFSKKIKYSSLKVDRTQFIRYSTNSILQAEGTNVIPNSPKLVGRAEHCLKLKLWQSFPQTPFKSYKTPQWSFLLTGLQSVSKRNVIPH